MCKKCQTLLRDVDVLKIELQEEESEHENVVDQLDEKMEKLNKET